jgi:thymidylate synthase ThyX
MHGTLRSWLHYIQLREANGTQKEHQDIAMAVKAIFDEQFPSIAEALRQLSIAEIESPARAILGEELPKTTTLLALPNWRQKLKSWFFRLVTGQQQS